MIRLPSEPLPGQAITANWGRDVVRYLRALTPMPSPTVRPSTNTGGTTYEAANKSYQRGTTHPFLGTSAWSVDDEEWQFTIEPGTYNSEYPTLDVDGDPVSLNTLLRPIGTLGDGEKHVYLKLEYTLNKNAAGYTYSAVLDAATIVVESSERSAPLGPNGSGVYYVLLASFMDGVKTAQPVITSLTGDVCDFIGDTHSDAAASSGDDTITDAGHGLTDGDMVTPSGFGAGTGIENQHGYYVVNVDGDTYQLAEEPGGAAIDILDDGSGSLRASGLAMLTTFAS